MIVCHDRVRMTPVALGTEARDRAPGERGRGDVRRDTDISQEPGPEGGAL